ncbi:DUF1836 domain-containing protein [Sutcliffiella horikoshii]|uniref:DUF1836 domain-containing protein n=1 Tax=Sutcliffiella horikoshii TaxID=79883 RepID=UPI00203FC7B8|nr:DUF1836 domain-containing protein [Sutcliffiella horikoshii]MCM3618054.1 DUF1836 domain-containing protein [Sutcliffiella horikoshii]
MTDEKGVWAMVKEWTRMDMAEFLEKMGQGLVPAEYRQTMPKSFQNFLQKKSKEEFGLTMSNIVWLGNQLESADYSEPALKNWVKREIKEYIGAPQVGRKYSIQQAALLFIVKDLKVLLDFEAIRKILGSIFNNPVEREDDIISPVHFYHAYSSLYDQLMNQTELLSEENIKEEIQQYLQKQNDLSKEDKAKIFDALMVAILAVRTNFLKAWAKRYVMDGKGKE